METVNAVATGVRSMTVAPMKVVAPTATDLVTLVGMVLKNMG